MTLGEMREDLLIRFYDNTIEKETLLAFSEGVAFMAAQSKGAAKNDGERRDESAMT